MDVMRAELAFVPVRYERCVCNQTITSEPYFGMLMPNPDQDAEAIVYFDRGHDQCLAEWGLTPLPDDPLGLRHCGETDDIRAS